MEAGLIRERFKNSLLNEGKGPFVSLSRAHGLSPFKLAEC